MKKTEKNLPWAFLDTYRGSVFQGEWPSVSQMFAITVKRYSDRPCFTDFDPEKKTLTYAQVLENVEKLAQWMLEQGAGKGDRIAVTGKNSPEWATVYLAALFAGCIIVPIDYGLHEKRLIIYSRPLNLKSFLLMKKNTVILKQILRGQKYTL